MKKILITGSGSFVGTSVEKWLKKSPDKYSVETLDMRNNNWKSFDFSPFDVVFHVAGIAHVSSKKKMESLYFKINRDLAILTANKAKSEGVKQFIFMSSMIIFGQDNGIGHFEHVNPSNLKPINAYGKSKMEADLAIQKLSEDSFKTVIIRAPVVFGPGCKGNFPRLQKLALKTPVFPNLSNQRSMIYIDNLAEFIKQIIETGKSGVFYPQNKEFISTKRVIELTRKAYGKKYRETKIFNLLIKILSVFFPSIKKVFGNKTYDESISRFDDFEYSFIDLEEAILKMKE